MSAGYIEWVSPEGIGIITTIMGRIVYVNQSGEYEKWRGNTLTFRKVKEHCKLVRKMTKDDLMLELL